MIAGCGDDPDLIDGTFTDAEFAVVETFSPVPDPPAAPTNRYADDPGVAVFGQRLFFEKGYAGALTIGDDGTNGSLGQVGETGRVACASCHVAADYFTDTRSNPNALSLGVRYTSRNAPSLVNVAFYEWWNWQQSHDSIWKQGAGGPESGANFSSTRLDFVHVVFDKYRADYDALFPVPLDPALDPEAADAARFPPSGRPGDPEWDAMEPADQEIANVIMANCGKALAAYERLLISRNAPIDRYIAGDFTALSPEAKRGLKLFVGKAGCVECHEDETFTDNEFHNTGVDQLERVPDDFDTGQFGGIGRLLGSDFTGAGDYSDDVAAGMAKLEGLVATDDKMGKFRTKSLRHIALTAPYMHNGSLDTLEEVVRFYNDGGAESGRFPGTKDPLMVPLNLSEAEISDLVAFLESLTGDPVPGELTEDTSAP